MNNYLLVIGGLPDPMRKLGYGGATVLMQNFVEELEKEQKRFKFIQTNRYFRKNTDHPSTIKNALYFISSFLWYLRSAQIIMFNFSDHATISLYPYLIEIAKWMGKKVVFRKFGGTLDVYLQDKEEKVKHKVFKAIDKADLIFLETKDSMKYIRKHINNKKKIHWFPNTRHSTPLRVLSTYQKRFVFISQVKAEKGVDDILAVASQLPEGYVIDLYGPIMEDKYRNFDWETYNVCYRGALTSDEITNKLTEYNLLLLLTSYREGYPGIIIEAMSIGMPVITTSAGGIPEIVQDQYNGIIVSAGNVKQIKESILSITGESYKKMGMNALSQFNKFFDSDKVNVRILNAIYSLW